MEGPRRKRSPGRVLLRAVLVFALVFGGALGGAALLHPDSPFPDAWNPLRPLEVAAPVTPLTAWKLRRTADAPALCRAALAAVAEVEPLTITETRRPECEVANPVRLRSIDGVVATLRETDCATALRLAMWTQHGVRPAARDILGTDLREVIDQGSFNCRPIRTPSGNSTRWSTHATAMAIDVSGFTLTDGRTLRLIADWDGEGSEARFLRAARDAACRWFVTTLSPDYNALHADHFHFQAKGWGTCR